MPPPPGRSAPAPIAGSGTVSKSNYREVGSSCVGERRAIEMLDTGQPRTSYMRFGDRVRMEATLPDGALLFVAIDQRVIAGGWTVARRNPSGCPNQGHVPVGAGTGTEATDSSAGNAIGTCGVP